MDYIVGVLDLLITISFYLPAPILYGTCLFLFTGLIRIIIDLL